MVLMKTGQVRVQFLESGSAPQYMLDIFLEAIIRVLAVNRRLKR